MAIRGNISLNDGAVVPVAHVYNPTLSDSSSGMVKWIDRSQAIFIGQNRLTVMQRLADRKTKTNKVSWKLETPILDVTAPSTMTGIQPAPTVAYTPLMTCEMVLPDRMTLQERKDALAQFRSLVASALVTAQVHDLDLIY